MIKGLQTGKSIILPDINKIEDVEIKRVFKELFRALQELNANNYSDHAFLDERVNTIEEGNDL